MKSGRLGQDLSYASNLRGREGGLEPRHVVWQQIGAGGLSVGGGGILVLFLADKGQPGLHLSGQSWFWPLVATLGILTVLGVYGLLAPVAGLPLPPTRTTPFWRRKQPQPWAVKRVKAPPGSMPMISPAPVPEAADHAEVTSLEESATRLGQRIMQFVQERGESPAELTLRLYSRMFGAEMIELARRLRKVGLTEGELALLYDRQKSIAEIENVALFLKARLPGILAGKTHG
jgi:hypothetical protein